MRIEMINLTHRLRWALVSVILYVLFVWAAIAWNFLDPQKIGLEWTMLWYLIAAGLAYYFYFKNVTYHKIIYYAQQLGYHYADLKAWVPKLRENQDVPNPDKPRFFSPFAKVPISATNIIEDKLVTEAKAKDIPPFR